MSAAVRSYFVPFVMQHRYFSARGIKQALGATPHFEQFSELASIFWRDTMSAVGTKFTERMSALSAQSTKSTKSFCLLKSGL